MITTTDNPWAAESRVNKREQQGLILKNFATQKENVYLE